MRLMGTYKTLVFSLKHGNAGIDFADGQGNQHCQRVGDGG